MRVLLVVNWFLKYATEQAVGLAEVGADVRVVCRDHLAEFAGDEQEWQECVRRLTAGTGRAPWIIKGPEGPRALVNGAAIARTRHWRPDIVHAHPNVSPSLFAALPRAPLVLTIHDVIPHPGQWRKSVAKKLIERGWEHRAAGFVVHGEELRALLRRRAGDRPIAVVPHGVRPEELPDPVPASPTVLFFGRLEPYKGLDILMDAMPLVWDVRPDARLVVAGRGPAESAVIDDPRIRKLTGYVPEAEVDDLFRGAQLLVAPYLEGSQSGVVSLACARGVPAIVSDIGALSDMVVDSGQVVAPGDPRALAEALIRNLDHSIEFREAVHRKARRELSWTAAAELTLRFYAELLDR